MCTNTTKVTEISGIVGSFSRVFFCTCDYTKVPFWAKIVHVSGMFIYPAVHLSGVHCIYIYIYIHTHTHTHTHTYVYVYMYICVCVYACKFNSEKYQSKNRNKNEIKFKKCVSWGWLGV